MESLDDRAKKATVEVRRALQAARDESEPEELLTAPASVLLGMAQFGEKPDVMFLHDTDVSMALSFLYHHDRIVLLLYINSDDHRPVGK